jgi:hypothetical protein
MNNEPVAIPFAWYCAWLGENNEPVWEQYEECHPATKQWDNFPDKIIPLYTHPVKELTDEDYKEALACLQFALDDTMDYLTLNNLGGENNHWLVWARAILRKAQEK